jgi:excisionase family DNA binding protein
MEFMTHEEIAITLRVHPRTVQRWLQKGLLRGYKLGNGKTALWRVSGGDFKKFLELYKNTAL